jgi:hydrogenase maturation protease
MKAEILVLGVGNPLLGDEGLGPQVIHELQGAYRFPPEVRLLDGGTAGLSLLSEVTAVQRLLVVDAVQTGAAPGTIVSLEENALRGARRILIGPHEIGVQELLAAARFHGGPRETVLFGIEPERMELALGLSSSVAKSLPKLMAAVMQRLASWGVEARPTLGKV